MRYFAKVLQSLARDFAEDSLKAIVMTIAIVAAIGASAYFDFQPVAVFASVFVAAIGAFSLMRLMKLDRATQARGFEVNPANENKADVPKEPSP